MDLRIFNVAMLAGWLFVLVGGVMVSPGWGLAAAGLLLIGLTLLSVRLAGGLVANRPKAAPPAQITGEGS